MVVKKIHEHKTVLEYSTKPSKTNIQNIFLLGIMYPLLFAMIFLIISAADFNIYVIIFSFFPLILSAILFIYYFLSKPKQLRVQKKGVTLITGLGKRLFSFSEIKDIAPIIKIDHKDYAFPQYFGINLRLVSEKEIFIVTNSTDARRFYSYYLKFAPEATNLEFKKIPSELNRFKNKVIHSSKIRDYIAVACILFSIIITTFIVPDVNLRGEHLTLPFRMFMGFIFGLLIAGGVLLYYGITYATNYKARIKAFNWRIEILNELLKKRNEKLFDFAPSALDDAKRVTLSSLRFTGGVMIIMGFIVPIIAVLSISKSGFSGGIFLVVFTSPLFTLGGFLLYRRALVK